jgi:hypothetical protein
MTTANNDPALAFIDASRLAVAKLAVLLASAVAGTVALFVGSKFLPVDQSTVAESATLGNHQGKVT